MNYSAALNELRAEIEYRKTHAIEYIFPDSGPLRRELYTKHVASMAAGATCHCRYFLGGNRCGKSRMGAYETALHATGVYPHWWTGFRIPESVGAPEIWLSGKTNEWLRDNAWKELLGPPDAIGTGMLPADSIYHVERESNPPGSVGRVWVKHISGKKALIGGKSWKEGRDSYAGTKRWFVWLDEEHPDAIVQECKLRTMSTVPGEPSGRILCTLTPLDGITEFIQPLINEPDTPDRRVFFCGWDDVPHLTEDAKRVMLAGMPEMQRQSRTRGIPDVGEGQVYPYAETSWLEDPIEIPEHWPRAYALDVGWRVTAALFGAWDRDSDTVHIYSEHYRDHAEVPIHAAAIRSRGVWIPGCVDPAAEGSSQATGDKLINLYRAAGLQLTPADNAVFAGLEDVRSRFATGRLKISRECVQTRRELPLYRWEKGKIVKKDDHCMDAMRYLVRTGLNIAKCNPALLNRPKPPRYPMVRDLNRGSGWMG